MIVSCVCCLCLQAKSKLLKWFSPSVITMNSNVSDQLKMMSTFRTVWILSWYQSTFFWTALHTLRITWINQISKSVFYYENTFWRFGCMWRGAKVCFLSWYMPTHFVATCISTKYVWVYLMLLIIGYAYTIKALYELHAQS